MASCPRLLQAAAIGSAIESKHLTYPHPLYYCADRQATEKVHMRRITDPAAIESLIADAGYTATAAPSDAEERV